MVAVMAVLAVVVVAGLLAVALAGVVVFNRLARARQAVQEAWAQIDVMLARRHGLFGDLARVAAGYAAFERRTLEDLVAARDRATATSAAGPAVRGPAEERVDRQVATVIARAEAYPDLHADEAFRRLSRELVAAEDDVSAARRYYNGRVRLYHDARESFPANLIAGVAHFRPAEYFQAEREEREVPDVAR
jgi:LemA protein